MKTSKFSERLSRCYDELKWLYCELYQDDLEAFRYFINMLEAQWEARKDALRALDEKRLAEPGWYRSNKLLGMMMYPANFGGNLRGVREKVGYLEKCGVNYLHLMPLLLSPPDRSDGGYAVADFRTVQPELGTMEDLENLADDCREKGISICLDFVMNHTSEDHAWAKAARAGDPVARSRYFFYDNWDEPDEYEKTVPQVFPTTAPGNFTWLDNCNQVVMTTFYPYQWDLNYANPMVFNDMTENMLYLANRGVNVIRLDAVPYIWKELGTSCRNLPQVHSLVRLMRLACEIVCPSVLILGEVVMEPSKVVPYFGSEQQPECHTLYNVTTMATTWHTVATKDVTLLVDQLDKVFALPKQYVFQNYLRCHDDIGWGLDYDFLARFGMEQRPHKAYLNDYFRGLRGLSNSRGELYNEDLVTGDARLCGTTASLCGLQAALESGSEQEVSKAINTIVMLHGYMLTQSGIPVLYSGDEIGQLNDDSYHDDPNKVQDSRYLHRGNMDWAAAERMEQSGTAENRIFTALSQLTKVRSEHDVFSCDAKAQTFDTGSRSVLGIMRQHGEETVIGVFNFGDEETQVQIPGDRSCMNLLIGETVASSRLVVPARVFYWLKRLNKKESGS